MTRILLTEPDAYGPAALRVLPATAEPLMCDVETQLDLVKAVRRLRPAAVALRLGLAADASLLSLPGLRWVASPTTGDEHLDRDAADRHAVRILTLRDVPYDILLQVPATAELTFAVILAITRRVCAASEAVRRNVWTRSPFLGMELAGRTLGVVGCGRLGSMVARYAAAFGMRVVGHDEDIAAVRAAGAVLAPLDELLKRSDVVTVHLPLTAATRRLLDARRIARMRCGAYLVNTSRGEIVDEDALLDALRREHLAGAALDVLAGESRWDDGTVPRGHRLVEYAREHENLLITPHIGGYAADAVTRTRAALMGALAARMAQDARG